MRRFYLKALFIAIAAVGLAAVLLRSSERVGLEDVLDVSRLGEEALPELLQRIRDFNRVVTRNGEKLLEVSAKEASYFKNDNAVRIVEPKLIFYSKGDEVGAISGHIGSLIVDGNDVASVHLEGSARLKLAKFEISSETIAYDRHSGKIHTTGLTEVRSPELALSGQDMEFDLTAKTLSMDSDVAMTLRKSADGS